MLSALLKKRPLPGLCAIDINYDGIAITRLEHAATKPKIEQCDFYPRDKDVVRQLKKLTSDHQLNRRQCITLLDREHYQILVMEKPPVPDNEVSEALRWRIKDLIDTPVTEITLDTFDVPPARDSGNSNSVYVVAANNHGLSHHSDMLLESDINLSIIDIKEMAQRNIASLLNENDNGVALLSVQSNSSLITLSRSGELYLSRTMNIGHEQIIATPPQSNDNQTSDDGIPNLDLNLDQANTAAYDQIALELQRSLDYYESNFRQAPIRKLHLAQTLHELPGFAEYMKDNLNLAVEVIDLNNLFEGDTPLTKTEQVQAFFSIGATLHRIENEPGN